VRKPPLGQAIDSPTTVVDGHPNKKKHRKGAQTSPNTLLRREPDASKGKGIVHRPDNVCYSNT